MGDDHYLITGGAGFIGSNTARALAKDGHAVRVIDDLSTGRASNLDGLLGPGGGVELVEASILDDGALRGAMAGVTHVIHLAALPSVQRSMTDPMSSHLVNADGTLAVMLAARDAGARRVVLASSSSVYGDSPTLPKHEEMPPRPLSPYAASKLTAECYAVVFTESLGLEVVCLRYFNVFGPRQDPDGEYAAVIPKFIERMLGGAAPTIFGDGTQSRDFCFIDNVVRANRLACKARDAPGHVINIACGERIDLLAVVRLLNRALGTDLSPVHDPPRTGDILHSLADIERARRLLSFEPEVTFEEGLMRTVDWFTGPGAQ